MGKQLRILFLSPEVVPFAKTGGLADVAGALPDALKRLGADIRVIMPFYRAVKSKRFKTRRVLANLDAPLGDRLLKADIHGIRTRAGVPVYFVEREDLYDRPNLYGSGAGDYYDNLERFAFYNHAALSAAKAFAFQPHVIHCHDWQTGLVPPLLKGPYRDISDLAGTRSVFTIHNIGYQGVFPKEKLPLTGLPEEDFFHSEGVEFWDNLSLLKAGIVYADAVTTVSRSYAQQILSPDYGMGMEGVLQRREGALHGILNGADYNIWDPARDSHLDETYSEKNMAGKVRCKEALLKETGLAPTLKERPLLGIISRLGSQKGLGLLLEVLDDLLTLEVGLVVLGSGDEEIQQALQEAAGRYTDRLAVRIGMNESLAHRIMAGVDMLLIPSRYEPCGLTQMYALKYGTVPVARATGGLDDTIIPFDRKTKKGNGFKFRPHEAKALLDCIKEAVDLYTDGRWWKQVMANAMEADFSWDRSAKQYLELYEKICERGEG
jgi:starch synthase